jgi:hypothetical protein
MTVATNSFPIAGARQYANRLIINVYQQWMYALDSSERDVLCWLVASTVGYGTVSKRIHTSDFYGMIRDVSRMHETERAARYAVLSAALDSLVARQVVIADPWDANGEREVMVNLRWKPEENDMLVLRGKTDE